MRRKKPTRNDLLAVIGSLQNIIGSVEGVATDSNPHRAAHIAALSKAGLQLCIDARDYDPPEAGEGSPWNVTVDLRGVI